jgi:NAD(P) transhydrogenase subunit alpha
LCIPRRPEACELKFHLARAELPFDKLLYGYSAGVVCRSSASSLEGMGSMKLGISVGVPKETIPGETRVAATPDSVKRLAKGGFDIKIEEGAGSSAGFRDEDYEAVGAEIVSRREAWQSQLVAKVAAPTSDETAAMQSGVMLVSLLEPFRNGPLLERFAKERVDALALEAIPRTSRAQAMDVLSSQAGIAGYRAVLEAAQHYGRFFPMMMTSAGSAKATKVTVLGAGVAGLQAIATARKLGATVEAYDVRPETREQIQSLGAKYIDIKLEESGVGQGGYARELSEESKQRLQEALDERLAKSDIIITTANVPGRKAPTLVSESVIGKMRCGSVVVDMATPSGGNCPLSVPDQVIDIGGVKIIGHTNYPAMMPTDASNFFARNLVSLLDLFVKEREPGAPTFFVNLEDDIIESSLLVHNGILRINRK